MSNFSVLISVYCRDKASQFDAALESICINQSVKPSEVVVVKDGPLTIDLENVIDKYRYLPFMSFKIIQLKENKGLGYALNVGIQKCCYDIVARMDSDDVSKNNRFEKQLEFFDDNDDIAVVGSWIDEFVDNINNIVSLRKVPSTNTDLKKYMKFRCPFNHPTVMFKKSKVLEAGSYDPYLKNMQDYDLWVRMASMKFNFANIQESLLFFRTSRDLFKRRGGLKYAHYDYLLQKRMILLGIINKKEFMYNILSRISFRLMPGFIRAYLYKNTLRK